MNWCVRTFIRTYVHVQKVWHLKEICQIKFMPGKKTGLTKPVPKAWLWEKIVVRQCHTVLESGMAFAGPAGLSTPPLMYMYTLWFTRLHAHQHVMNA